jgi:hypothetical protein
VEESSRRRFARYVHVKNLNFLFYCSNIAKSENAMLWRMLSRLETWVVYSCIWSVTLAKSIVPRKTWRKLWHWWIDSLNEMFLSRWTAHEQWNITFILLKTRREEGHQSVREFITRQTCKICDYTVDYMCRTKTSKSHQIRIFSFDIFMQ